MATGPHDLYNKAADVSMKVGTLAAGDFTTGIAANIQTGLGTVLAAGCTMNADTEATAAQVSVDINSDGTITVNQWSDAHAAASVEVACSWWAVGN